MALIKGIVSGNGVAIVKEDASRQQALCAARAFEKGELIAPFQADETFLSPTYLTIQKDDDVHITLSPSFLQYVNHSCSPNAFFDTNAMKFVAVRKIYKGDELTFFYPSTEWKMAQAFRCHCGNSNCLTTIQGAAFLPDEVLQCYQLADYILRKLAQRKQEECKDRW